MKVILSSALCIGYRLRNEPDPDVAASRGAVRENLQRLFSGLADGEHRHKAIIAYLTSSNLNSSAAALREELNLGDSFDAATTKKYEGLLEKKWTSVVRLQKKVRMKDYKVYFLWILTPT